MKSYPFDSKITGVEELQAPGGEKVYVPTLDRGHTAKDLQEFDKNMWTDGISKDIENCLKVSPGTGMNVIVSPGFCMCGGARGNEPEQRTLAVQAADPSFDRIDAVVARSDNSSDFRNVDLYVVKGTPGVSPSAPAPTRDETTYEIVLAHLFIAHGTSSISAYRITDTRLNDSICGIMQPRPGVNTTGIFDQYQAALDEFLKTVQEAIDGTTAGNLQSQITENKESIGDKEELTTEDKTNLVLAINETNKNAHNAQKSADDNSKIIGALESLETAVKTSVVGAINWLKSQLDSTNTNVSNLNNKLTSNIHKRISGVAQTGTAGRIYAQKNGKYIDIDIVLSGCSVGRTYEWYNIGYVDVSKLGVTSTEYAYGQAYYSGGGPAYGDEGGQTTIRCESQSSGRVQLIAQCSKTMSGDKYFVASIHVPIVS